MKKSNQTKAGDRRNETKVSRGRKRSQGMTIEDNRLEKIRKDKREENITEDKGREQRTTQEKRICRYTEKPTSLPRPLSSSFFSALKTEAAHSFEILVPFYQTTCRDMSVRTAERTSNLGNFHCSLLKFNARSISDCCRFYFFLVND
jgi:hypothetical protein